MKKIIIVNNNMKIGGVQKSLYNLLWSLDTVNKYDITLLLFDKSGEYIDKLPESIRIVECGGPFRYLGKSQGEFKNSLKDTVVRGVLAGAAKVFGRNLILRLMLLKQPLICESFDCAVSFLHNGRKKSFYGGVQDYVLSRINAVKKVAYLHCDYINCGADHKENNLMMSQFDKIAACSNGCRYVFESALPNLRDKCLTVLNCHRFDEITALAEDNPIEFDDAVVNVITVARLTHEKGIDRSIKAVAAVLGSGLPVRLHIVGNGAMYEELLQLARSMGIEEHIVFYGEQSNPYRYMKNADLLLLSSYHEAAPIVIDEARCLGIPILTTQTTSSKDMVLDTGCGWVCENTLESLIDTLRNVIRNREELIKLKNKLLNKSADNKIAISQFYDLIDN